ncbi:hypothetical protein BX070DRAFT_48171 [Coemansia spiralis]|nr:hypothetical protein BX070DRAFT_48171 [Coemansia spiralis]
MSHISNFILPHFQATPVCHHNDQLVTQDPGNHRISSVPDIARDFRVSLLKGMPSATLKMISSPKGISELLLFLGASAFFAFRIAGNARDAAAGVKRWFC